jgi:peptidoglycan/LPS O-acetylase OafA/YrhL
VNQLVLDTGRNGVSAPTLEHNARPAYRADIDGLRAVAILAVVVFHAFPSVLRGGFVGVDIFFVISGYLISRIIFDSQQQGDFSLAEFYAHRIKRIFPGLLVVLASCFVMGWIQLLPDEFSQLGKHMAGGMGFVANFLLWGEAGYFDTASEFKPLMHLWSLGIEEQFYLFYPLVVGLAWGQRRRVVIVVAGLAVVSFGLGLVALAKDPVGGFFLPQHRFWELLAGGLLALGLGRNGWGGLAFPWRHGLSLGGLGCLLAAVSLLHSGLDFPGWWAVLPVAGAASLIAAGPEGWANRWVLANPVMRFIGLISYPLYLWHWPLLSFARITAGGEPGLLVRWGAVVLSGVLAWATWRLVERPIRFGAPSRFKTLALCLAAVLVGWVGYHTFEREGFHFRLRNFGEGGDGFAVGDAAKFSPECRQSFDPPAPEYCLQTAGGNPRVALVGDSHANSLYPGLGPALAQRGVSLLHLGGPGCAPLLDTVPVAGDNRSERDCKAMVNQVIHSAANHPTVETVVLALRGPRNMYGTGFGPIEASMKRKEIRWLGAREEASQPEMFSGALKATVEVLLAGGKRVVIVADWPELGFDPRGCLDVRPLRLSQGLVRACEVGLPEVRERNRAYRALLESLAGLHPEVSVFDPWPLLCGERACRALEDGRLLYRDNNHLSVEGSRLLGRSLAERLP